jgi:FAD/FMN-containing dehydrogenase
MPIAPAPALALERARSAPAPWSRPEGCVLNDVHGRLSATRVSALVFPRSLDELRAAVRTARELGRPLSLSGGRHAMGGQPFARGALHVDTTGLARVLGFDPERGLLEVEAGIQWPALLAALRALQPGGRRWGIRQKQTGADHLSLGGALSANVHGRGLTLAPLVADIDSCVVVDARGAARRAGREEHPELFRHVVGGYGLFGALYSLRLRLAPLSVLQRRVRPAGAEAAVETLEQAARAGATYGDFQFTVDPRDERFLQRGVLSTYHPVDAPLPEGAGRRALTRKDWRELLRLAHVDKRAAFERYAEHYRATDGQLYDSDGMQTGFSLDGCHAELEEGGHVRRGSELISELYVPRPLLAGFLAAAARELRRRDADVVYGTLRLIERDDETALAWARQRWACAVLNLHVDHEPQALGRARDAFRALIDLALERGGSYYLTYHRFARRDQVLAAHPTLPDVLRRKLREDPDEVFSSEWYRHQRRLLGI